MTVYDGPVSLRTTPMPLRTTPTYHPSSLRLSQTQHLHILRLLREYLEYLGDGGEQKKVEDKSSN